MSEQHDYKAALSWFNRANWDERVPEIHAIRHALLCMDALMQEPSKGMVDALREEYGIYRGAMHYNFAEQLIKAARDQLIKEATDGR